MFARYFVVLSFIVLLVSIIDTSEGNPIAVAAVTKIIGHLFKGAAKRCLKQAAEECQGQLSNPKEALNCAKNFLKNNKGRCAIG